jgi:hypothetical protein
MVSRDLVPIAEECARSANIGKPQAVAASGSNRRYGSVVSRSGVSPAAGGRWLRT